MKLPSVKRLVKEDFPSKYYDLLDALMPPLNQSLESTYNALTNGLTARDNMAWQEIDLQVTAPISNATPIFFKKTVKGTCRGLICVNAVTAGNGTPPTGQPFITFTDDNSGSVRITSITNLTSGSSYTLRVYVLT